MNSTRAVIGDQDIYAFHPVPPSKPGAVPPRQRRWPWAVLGCLLALAVLSVLGAFNLLALLASFGDGWNVTINGHQVDPSFAVQPEHAWAALFAAAAGIFLLLLVVPITVLLVLVVVTGALALAVGCALLVMVLVAAVLLSPLWLPAWLIWLILRSRTRPTAPASAG